MIASIASIILTPAYFLLALADCIRDDFGPPPGDEERYERERHEAIMRGEY